jgi:hypothetical protein
MVLIKFVNLHSIFSSWVREFIDVCLCDLWWESQLVFGIEFFNVFNKGLWWVNFFIKIFINKMDMVNISNPKYLGLVHCQA